MRGKEELEERHQASDIGTKPLGIQLLSLRLICAEDTSFVLVRMISGASIFPHMINDPRNHTYKELHR